MIRFFIFLILAIFIISCGQRGPLYLPKPDTEKAPSTKTKDEQKVDNASQIHQNAWVR